MRRRVGVLVAVAALGLGACGGGGGDSPTSAPTASATSTTKVKAADDKRDLPDSREPVSVKGNIGGVELSVQLGPLAVTGDVAVLPVTVKPQGGSGTASITGLWSTYDEDSVAFTKLRLIDPDTSDGLPVISPAATPKGAGVGSNDYVTLRPEDPAVHADLVVPAPTTATVDVLVPAIGYVTDVPVLPADMAEDVEPLATYTDHPDDLILPRGEWAKYVEDVDGALSWTGGQMQLTLDSDVLFATSSAELSPDADAVLSSAAAQLAEAGGGGLSVVGHTDDVGDDAANQKLSEQRAQAVADRLAQLTDLSAFQVTVEGRGESEPAVADITDQARAANRRVTLEFKAPTEILITGVGDDAAPDATGPVGLGAVGVQVVTQYSEMSEPAAVTITASEVHRVHGVLTGQLRIRNDSAEEITLTDAIAREDVADWGLVSGDCNAGGAALLVGGKRVYPLSVRLDPDLDQLAEWAWLTDPDIAYIAPGTTYTATMVWPDVEGDVVTIDVPPAKDYGGQRTPFRLTDIPVVED